MQGALDGVDCAVWYGSSIDGHGAYSYHKPKNISTA
jgi:hypothetical protein